MLEKENINAMDTKGEVLLTIMTSLAQQESQSLSQNVKLGLQYCYQQGKVQVNHNRFMGYTKDEEGNLIIVPEEAEIIKRIYTYRRNFFLQAQEELHRRKNIYTGADKNKRLYRSKYALSTLTFCGDCGDIYRRVYWNIHGRKEFVWRCVTRIEQGPEVCKNRTVKEGELYDAVMTAINRLLAGGDNMIRILEENIHAVIGDTTEYKISEINTLLEEKQKEVISLANKGKDYEYLADEIGKLREKRQRLLVEDASLSGENERINELIVFIRRNKYRTLLYDDTLVRKLIQNVTVYEELFVISLKSGIEIEV